MAKQSSRRALAASTRIEPIRVEAAGRWWTIPKLPAADWILAVSEDEPVTAVFPGLLNDAGAEHVGDMLVRGTFPVDHLRNAAFSAIKQASGWNWWEAMRLVGMADAQPEVVGELTLRGLDPESVPFGRWCHAVYALATKNLDEKERAKFEAKFTFPPEGFEEDEDAGMSFESMVQGFRNLPGARLGG